MQLGVKTDSLPCRDTRATVAEHLQTTPEQEAFHCAEASFVSRDRHAGDHRINCETAPHQNACIALLCAVSYFLFCYLLHRCYLLHCVTSSSIFLCFIFHIAVCRLLPRCCVSSSSTLYDIFCSFVCLHLPH